MRFRIGKAEFSIPWEYLVAFLLILLALSLIIWKADQERGETIRIMATATPSSENPVGSVPRDNDENFYDVPDADDEESRPGKEPPASLRVNVNRAGMEELMSLPYIGEVKARAIISYRDEHGPFSSPGDLLNVKGIGPKTLERIRPYIVCE